LAFGGVFRLEFCVTTKNEPGPGSNPGFGQSPFAGLNLTGLPPGRDVPAEPPAAVAKKARNRGRVDIRREKAGRGGKTVTVVSGFVGIGAREKEDLAQRMRRACGTGGTVKDGNIEIQGDQRQAVAEILTEAGFRPVFAGG
jgi:translation initiation factor 1